MDAKTITLIFFLGVIVVGIVTLFMRSKKKVKRRVQDKHKSGHTQRLPSQLASTRKH